MNEILSLNAKGKSFAFKLKVDSTKAFHSVSERFVNSRNLFLGRKTKAVEHETNFVCAGGAYKFHNPPFNIFISWRIQI